MLRNRRKRVAVQSRVNPSHRLADRSHIVQRIGLLWHWSLQNRSQGPFKISPGGAWGHQKPFLGAPRAASRAAMAQLGTHFGAPGSLRTHLGAHGPHFGGPGNHFRRLGPPLGGARGAPWQDFFDLAAMLSNMLKPLKNLSFP